MIPEATLNHFVCATDNEEIECSLVNTDRQPLIPLIALSRVRQCLSVPGGHPVHLRSARKSSKCRPPTEPFLQELEEPGLSFFRA